MADSVPSFDDFMAQKPPVAAAAPSFDDFMAAKATKPPVPPTLKGFVPGDAAAAALARTGLPLAAPAGVQLPVPSDLKPGAPLVGREPGYVPLGQLEPPPEDVRKGMIQVARGAGELLPPPAKGASTAENIGYAAHRAALNLISPESLSQVLLAEGLGAAIPAAVNLPRVAEALKNLPTLSKALDIAAHAAVPGYFAGAGAKGVVESEIAREKAAPNSNEKTQAATNEVINAIMAVAGGYGVKKSVEAAAAAYPPAVTPEAAAEATKVGGIATPEVSAPTAQQAAETLATQGRGLAAENWKQLARTKAGDVSFTVDTQNGPVTVAKVGTHSKYGEVFQATDKDGNVKAGGSAEQVDYWIRQNSRGEVLQSVSGPARAAVEEGQKVQGQTFKAPSFDQFMQEQKGTVEGEPMPPRGSAPEAGKPVSAASEAESAAKPAEQAAAPTEAEHLTPEEAITQWGKLKVGQVIDSPKGPMTIIRADNQKHKMAPRITVKDQDGHDWVPGKAHVEGWAQVAPPEAPAEESASTPAGNAEAGTAASTTQPTETLITKTKTGGEPTPLPAVGEKTGTKSGEVSAATAEHAFPALPQELAGAKPRYSYGPRKFELEFASDFDKAAYIAAQEKPSKQDAEYVKYATGAVKSDEEGIRQYGRNIRDTIKQIAKRSQPGVLKVPAQSFREDWGVEKQLPEPGDFTNFFHLLHKGDTIESPAGKVEIVKTNTLRMQPVMPIGPRGSWAGVGAGERTMYDLDAKLPDGAIKHFTKPGDFENYLRGKGEAAAPKPQFKEGDRVKFTSNKGEHLTGTVEHHDSESNTYSVNIDQIKRPGGVPLGRISTVHARILQPLDQEPAQNQPEAAKPKTAALPISKGGYAEHQLPGGGKIQELKSPELAFQKNAKVRWTDANGIVRTGYVSKVEGFTVMVGNEPDQKTGLFRPVTASRLELLEEPKGEAAAPEITPPVPAAVQSADRVPKQGPGESQTPGQPISPAGAKEHDPWRDMIPGAETDTFYKGKTPNQIEEPKAGETWYHGRRGEIAFSEDRPAFFTRERQGAEWYANDRGARNAEPTIGEFHLDIKHPAHLRDLLAIVKETKATTEDIAKHSPYAGDNPADYLYVPKIREALEAKGFDGYVGFDPLENNDIDLAVPLHPKQAKALPKTTGSPTVGEHAPGQTPAPNQPEAAKPKTAALTTPSVSVTPKASEKVLSKQERIAANEKRIKEIQEKLKAKSEGEPTPLPASSGKAGAESGEVERAYQEIRSWLAGPHAPEANGEYGIDAHNDLFDELGTQDARGVLKRLHDEGFLGAPKETSRGPHYKFLPQSLLPASKLTPAAQPAGSAEAGAAASTPKSEVVEVVKPESQKPVKPETLNTGKEKTVLPSTAEKTIVEAEKEHPRATVSERAPETVAGEPSEAGGAAEEVGGTGSGDRGESGEVSGRLQRERGERAEPGPGEGTRAPRVRDASAGERAGLESSNYRITPEDHIGEGSLRQKAADNLAAIRALKTIEAEGRQATPDEQKLLVKYVGWGGMPQPFAEWNVPREWQGVSEELKGLLSDEDFASARASTPNAHYTSPLVIKGIWDALTRLGFGKANDTVSVIEPAMGAGHFFGLMPEEIATASQKVGIELDTTSGKIARLLYPKADVHVAGFEQVKMPDSYFDLAVSNVPFGNYAVHDPAYKRNPGVTRSIHDYFFAKAIDKVRPGGVVAFITSNYTMDKRDPYMRKYLADRADLLGAIRLPNTAFKGNAGTEVTTDIIFLQRRAPQTAPKGESWTDLEPFTGASKRPDGSMGTAEMELNEYYVRHPEMMLGTMGLEGTMYRDQSPALTGELTEEKLAAAIRKLPENAFKTWEAPRPEYESTAPQLSTSGHLKEGAYAVHEGTVVRNEDGQLKPVDVSPDQAARIKGMIEIRDAMRKVFETQYNDAPENEIKSARAHLNRVYDHFVKRSGFLSTTRNVRAFAEDPDAPSVLSLENWDSDEKKATKTPIFSERTIDKYKPAERADNATDALSISLNEHGRIDWARMQQLTGRTPEEMRAELGPLVYRNPAGKNWETADEYLAGNVRRKLAEAEAAARGDKSYERNVEALKPVQPEDLAPEMIEARLGASWIPADDVAKFVSELLSIPSRNVQVSHSEALATWTLKLSRIDTVANTQTYGTPRYYGHELISDALNLKNPTVYDTVGSGEDQRTVINEQQTLAAREMQQQIKDKFKEWVWGEPERSDRLAKAYNEEFNSDRLWQPNGAHLSMPGMSTDLKLKPHQKNAIWRGLRGGNVLLAHVVGAGKTFEMIGIAKEARRLGLAKKPMMIVPKNRVDATGAEYLRMYPGANVLVMSSEDFTPDNRQKLMGRIATGNWDGVIVSYESFQKLPVSDDTFNEYMQEQIDDLENYIREAKHDKADARMVKELEKAKKRLEAKLRGKADREAKDTGLNFEELGVDMLLVDEADNFKNLFFPTKMTRVAGIPNTESKRAFDMYIKTQHIAKRNGGRGIVFATGTPIANTMAEMFTMQRYLQPQWLRDHGLQHFDAWAQTFGEVVPTLEVSTAADSYRMTNRFARFVNIPELTTGFRAVADVQTAEMLKLPVPKVKGGGAETVAAPASESQKAYIQSLAKRAKDIRDRVVKDPRVDNMLKVSTDGRKAALDMRLVDPAEPDHAESKLNRAVSNVFEVWQAGKKDRSTQLVFVDFSSPRKKGEAGKFTVPDDMKAKLVAKGIPEKEIAFAQTAESDAAKEKLFKDVNEGKVRVLFGSTPTLGVGVNVQKRLIAEHHLDAPWRPRDIEQREGRIIRQGNTNPEVQLFRYVTEPSFDAKMWDTLKTKATFIGQVMSGDTSVRTADDISDTALSYAEVSAIASGNPAIREKTIVDTQVRKLDSLRTRHEQQQSTIRRELQSLPATIDAAKAHLKKIEGDIQTRDAHPGEVTIGKQHFTAKEPRMKAAEAIQKAIEKHRGDTAAAALSGQESKLPVIGTYRGLNLTIAYSGISESRLKELPDVRIEGNVTYRATTNQEGNADGTMRSIESAAARMESNAEQAHEIIEKAEKKLADFKPLAGKPFEKAAQLKELLAKQAELAKQLQTAAPDPQIMGDDLANDHPEDLNDLQAIKEGSEVKRPLPTVTAQEPTPSETSTRSVPTESEINAGPAVRTPSRERGSFSNREIGPHGPVTRAFKNKPKAALEWLRQQKNGFAADAVPHPELGSIGLPFGQVGDPAHDFNGGYGVSHIDAKHPGYLDDNIEKISALPIVERFHDKSGRVRAVVLSDGSHRAVISHDWKGKPAETWLLTAYDRPASTASVSVRRAPQGAGPTSPTTGGGTPASNITPAEEEVKTTAETSIPAEPEAASTTPKKTGEKGGINPELLTLGGSKFIQEDIAPTAKEVLKGLRDAKDGLQSLFAPASRKGAKPAAMFTRHRAAEFAQATDRAEKALENARKFFDKRPREDNLDFMNRIETGQAQLNSELQAIADILRTLLDGRREQVQELGTGKLQNWYENYFPHIWKKPDQAAEVMGQFYGRRPLEGPKAFLKRRTIPTIAYGIEHGLELASDNPVDIALAKIREMDKYVMAHKVKADLQDEGMLKFVRSGDQKPAGYAYINDNVFTVFGPRQGAVKLPEDANIAPEQVSVIGRRIMGQYAAPEPAALLINNYLSPGWREKSGLFRAYLGLGNVLNQFQLGWSAFHLAFTALDAATSKFALGVYQIGHGDVAKGIGSIAQYPIELAANIPATIAAKGLEKLGVKGASNALAPFSTILRGDRLAKEWDQPGTMGAEIAQQIDAMLYAGGRRRMEKFYATNITANMMTAFRRGNVWGGILRVPFAATEQAIRPVLEYAVPRMKMGVFADMARYELDRLGPDATPEDAREALARAWDSVDNRMGQLVYDNLFWNKTMKDLSMASIRSVGWNTGTIREVGGGLVDTAKFGTDSARYVGSKLTGGGGGKPPELTHRQAYIIALPFVVGSLGAMLMYLWTGHGPRELKDYFWPKDAQGKRWALPSYIKDIEAYATSPTRTVAGKLHPLARLIYEMLSNKDFFDKEIRNHRHPPMKQAIEAAEHIGTAFEPMAARNIFNKPRPGGPRPTLPNQILPFVGVTPAPAHIQNPNAHPHHRP